MEIVNILALLLVVGGCLASKLPDDWTRCPESDGFHECLRGAMEYAIHSLASKGNPVFGVLPLDPMHFDRLLINQGSGPVSIKLEYVDIDVSGLKNIRIKNVSGNWSELLIKADIPVITSLTGGYSVEGKVLALPIVGNGHCNLTFHEFGWDPLKIQFKQEKRKGKNYLNIEQISMIPQSSFLQMDFQGLFNNDKIIGPRMNLFLNENWEEIFNELKPAISKAFGLAYKDVGNRILSKIPTDGFF